MDIPKGETFSSKVIVVPGYAFDFTLRGIFVDIMEGQNYCWVERGEPIGEFRIHGSLGDDLISRWTSSKLHSAKIKSPVSGLLLHSTLKDELPETLEDWNAMENPPLAEFAMLLPDGEPKPESGEYIYSEMCNLIRAMSHYYYNRKKWSPYKLERGSIEKLIGLQLNAQPIIFDAVPTWGDYLDEARIKKPELRRYLKHLSQAES